MSVETSAEIDYTRKVASHGSYSMNRVLPQNQSNQDLNPNSTTETQIELPNSVYNLSKSTLDWEVNVPAVASRFNRLHALGLNYIDRVTLSTRGGEFLADVTSCFEYTNATAIYLNKMEEFLEQDSNRGSATDVAADKGRNLYRSNVAVPTATPGVSLGVNGTRISATGVAQAPSQGSTETTYFIQSASNTDIFQKYSVPLKALSHTIMSMDKDLFFNENLLLNVHWSSAARVGFMGSSATVLATDAAAISSTIALTNIRLYLAVETNEMVTRSLTQKVMGGGMKLNVPYVYTFTFSSPAGTSSSVQQRFNSSHGKRLLSIYHSLYSNTSTGRLTVDNNNIAQAKVLDFQSQLNNQNLQQFRPQSVDSEDYILMRPLLAQ